MVLDESTWGTREGETVVADRVVLEDLRGKGSESSTLIGGRPTKPLRFPPVTLCTLVLACSLSHSVYGQVQIMPADKLAELRRSIPARLPDDWKSILNDPSTLVYTAVEMPSAYQHPDVDTDSGRGGSTSFHWSGYNISAGPDEAAKGDGHGGNASIEFPWQAPGGTNPPGDRTDSFKLLWLPKQTDGRPWPVILRQETLLGALTGPHLGYVWQFPVGAVLGEVLRVRDSRGQFHTFEIRLRTRETDSWDIDLLRPFPAATDLARRLEELDKRKYAEQIAHLREQVALQAETLTDGEHPTKRAFTATAAQDVLPDLGEDLAIQLLDTTPFRSALGATWRQGEAGNVAFAPTSHEPFSIVPQSYQGTFVGTDTNSCAKCHDSTLHHADEFDGGRDWYGYVRGSDQIFSFHPIAPEQVSRNGQSRPVTLRPEFVAGGLVAWYDAERHPSPRYPVRRVE